MTRVTQLSMANQATAGLQASLSQLQALQNEASSGRRITAPSDDPQGTASSMRMRSEQAQNAQYATNADFATARLNVADQSLQSLSDQLRAARNLVVRSQDGQMSDAARSALSAQMVQIKGSITSLYNTQYLGRPIFGGTTASDVTLDANNAYVGDGNPVLVKVSNSTSVRVDVDGSSIAAGTVPALMDQLAADVNANPGAPQSDLDSIDAVLSKVAVALGNVGAAQNQVTSTSNTVSAQNADLSTSIAHIEGADLTEVLTKFASQQVAYQTAVGVAAKINQISLLDFLR